MNQSRYLFRGKREHGDEWVQGSLMYPESGNCSIWSDRLIDDVSVIPSTVGQCTGVSAMKSYRGDRPEDLLIFEDDIVTDPTGLYIRAQVIWHEKNLAWGVLTLGGKNYPLCAEHNCEIIGTIHDDEGEFTSVEKAKNDSFD